MKLLRPKIERKPRPTTVETADAPIEPLKTPLIDPEEIIPHDKLKGLKRYMKKARQQKIWHQYLDVATCIATLFPERRNELSLNLAYEEMLEKAQDSRRRNDWWGFSSLAEQLIILYPDRKNELGLDEAAWTGMKKSMEANRGTVHKSLPWRSFTQMAARLTILFPERKHELGLDEAAWTGMKENMESYRNRNSWFDFASVAMQLTIIFPERKHELGLDDTSLDRIKKTMEAYRDTDWHSYAIMATYYAALSVDEIRFSIDGMELINHERPRETHDLPERQIV